ncbi:MAG: hypothetical protein ACHQU0_03425 [Candidatus Paceibacteria bacterium]
MNTVLWCLAVLSFVFALAEANDSDTHVGKPAVAAAYWGFTILCIITIAVLKH